MNPMDIELFGTRELIDELMRRTTFQGVIVHAVDGAKSATGTASALFAVRHNGNLDTEEAGRLLDVVSQHIAGRG